MSLPCLLSCRPGSGQGASKLRSGGAGSKAGLGGGRSSLDSGPSIGCKRRLAALPENQVDHVVWKEIFGIEEDDGTSLESVDLKKVGVVGLSDSIATQLVDCFAGKPSVANIGLFHGSTDGSCSKYDVMPGVTVLPTAREVCSWSDVIFLCCSYEDTYAFLRTKSHHKALKGKCVLQLGSGTPEEAVMAAKLAKTAGAKYLDAFVFSEGTSNVFNHRLSAMMVSGDKKAWRGVEGIVRAAAPASFYGGRRVEWANTIGVGVVAFLVSVRMGLNQAQSITSKFGLPNHVLPRVLKSGYMSVVKAIVSNENNKPFPFTSAGSLQTSSAQPATSSANTLSNISGLKRDCLPAVSGTSSFLESPMHGRHATQASAPDDGTPPVGSAEWVSQLERIREVCQKAQVNHALIDGFLAASGAPLHPKMPNMNPYMPLITDLANSHMSEAPYGADQENLEAVEPLADVFGTGDAPEKLDFDIQEVLMDTDMVGDDVLLAGWAP